MSALPLTFLGLTRALRFLSLLRAAASALKSLPGSFLLR